MSKIAPLLLVAALALTVPAVSAAEPASGVVSAADLGAACTDPANKTCSAYIEGFAAGFYYATSEARAGVPACVPHALAAAEARAVVTQFISRHPEMAQQGAPSVVTEALLTTFPCAKPK